MPLTVETGLGIDPAVNSYVTLIEARTLAAGMGLSLPAVDLDAENALALATRWLEGFRGRWQGHASTGAVQSLSWPRRLVTVEGQTLADNTIPLLVKKAQVSAAIESVAGAALFENSDGKFIISDKVDVLETKWSEKIFTTPDGKPRFPAIDVYVKPLLTDDFGWRLSARHRF